MRVKIRIRKIYTEKHDKDKEKKDADDIATIIKKKEF